MNFRLGLLIGLIIGWIAEWTVDVLFWRRQDQTSAEQLPRLQAEIQRLRRQLAERGSSGLVEPNVIIQELRAEIRRLEGELYAARQQFELSHVKLQDAEMTIEELRAELNQATDPAPRPGDRLERIKGIGAVFARRLRQAGIHTFAELAALPPDRIREIVQVNEWQKIEPEKWIAQANELANEK